MWPYRLAAACAVPLLGGRSLRHRVGPAVLKTYRFGPEGGEPWVLLHGLGSTALTWLPILRDLSRDARLWIPELSSHGGTVAPFGGLNVQEGVAAVIDLIESRAPGRQVTLAGVSLGGWIAVRLALERPDLVERLLLIACGGYRDQDWNRVREIVRVEQPGDAETLLHALFRRPPLRFRWGRALVRRIYRSPAVVHVLETIRPADAFGPDDLATIAAPTGLIWGDHDGIFQVEVGRAMQAWLPEARLEVLEDCGHVAQWDRPREMAEATGRIRAWWAR